MNFGEELRRGFIYSILGSFVVSTLFSAWGAILEVSQRGVLGSVGAFIGGLLLFGFWGLFFVAFFSAVIGIPLYYVLRKVNLANMITITSIGALMAYLYGIESAGDRTFHILFVVYGSVCAFSFWLGSHVERKKL